MRSPVSRRALGECNAITSRRFGHSELTFVDTLETRFADSFRPATTHSGLGPAATGGIHF